MKTDSKKDWNHEGERFFHLEGWRVGDAINFAEDFYCEKNQMIDSLGVLLYLAFSKMNL